MHHVRLQGLYQWVLASLLERLWCIREWPTVPRDHIKFWILTNQRRQNLDPNQSDLWNSKGPLELATLCYTTVSLLRTLYSLPARLTGLKWQPSAAPRPASRTVCHLGYIKYHAVRWLTISSNSCALYDPQTALFAVF